MKFFGFLAAAAALVTGCSLAAFPAGAATCGPTPLPHEIIFEQVGYGQPVQYQRATPQAPLVAVAAGDNATRAIFDCHGQGTQFINFNLVTSGGWFSGPAPVGDHIAILTRATMGNLTTPGQVQYVGRGPILTKDYGPMGELMRRNDFVPGTDNVCQNGPGEVNGRQCLGPFPRAHGIDFVDNDSYTIETQAAPGNIAYAVSRPSMGQRIQQAWHESYTHETLTGHQIAIAFLYGQPPAGRTYRVHIYNISAGWF